MSDLIQYSPDIIFKYKECNKLTDELNEYLLSIKKCTESCTDSKDFKIKLKKYDIKLNSSKWYRKRFMTNDEKIKKNINSLLNKLTEKNYEEITDKVLKLKIENFDLLEYLCKNVLEKCLLENEYLKNWCFLIQKLFTNNLNKWNYNNKHIYIIFLDLCQKKFEKMLNINYHEKLVELYTEDIDLFYKLKNKNCNLIMLLGEFYNLNFLDIDTTKSIIKILMKDKDKYYELELGILFSNSLQLNSLNNKVLDSEVVPLLSLKNLNKKIKFMIMDIMDKKKLSIKVDKTSDVSSDEEIEVKIKNIINEYISEQDYDYSISCFKEIISKPKSNKVIYQFLINLVESESKRFNEIFNLIKKLIKDKCIKYNNVKFGIIEFLQDYNELILDYPNLGKIVEKILTVFCKIKVLDNNTIKFILSKSNLSKELINSYLKIGKYDKNKY